MSYPEIAKVLNIGKNTAIKACEFEEVIYVAFSIYRLLQPKERYIWVKIRILYETDKAILVYNGGKFWSTSLNCFRIQLRRTNSFEAKHVSIWRRRMDPQIADMWDKTKK